MDPQTHQRLEQLSNRLERVEEVLKALHYLRPNPLPAEVQQLLSTYVYRPEDL